MMTLHPEEKIDDWISAGAKTLIIHKHSTENETLERIFNHAQEKGVEVAIALKPSTSNEELAPFIDRVSLIQCMGNDNIGFHGVVFDESVLGKIKDIRERYGDVTIGVDIGVNTDTAPRMVEVGVTRLVSGSAIYNAENIEDSIQQFQSL